MGVLKISDYDGTGGNQDEFFEIWVQVHGVHDFTGIAD